MRRDEPDGAASIAGHALVAPAVFVFGLGVTTEILPLDDGTRRVVDAEDHRVGGDVQAIAFVLSPGKTVEGGHAFGDAPDGIVGIGRGHRPHRTAVGLIDAGHHIATVDHVDVGPDDVHSLDLGVDRGLPGDPIPEGSGRGRSERVHPVQFEATLGELLISIRVRFLGGDGG